MDIDEVQQRTHEWRLEEFGEPDPIDQLFGTMLELGEVGGPVLKAKYYDEEWIDEEHLKTEIGDVLIYFLGVASIMGYDISDCIRHAEVKNGNRDWEEHKQAP